MKVPSHSPFYPITPAPSFYLPKCPQLPPPLQTQLLISLASPTALYRILINPLYERMQKEFLPRAHYPLPSNLSHPIQTLPQQPNLSQLFICYIVIS